MSSRASQLFQEITSASSPAQTIAEMIRNQQQETDYLEFKRGDVNPKDAKRYWSKALSGFANTEGGVLIWGVDARKTKSVDDPQIEIDAARDAVHVPNPIEFTETLRKIQLHATLDPVAGIDIRSFDAGSGPGFVVCYVPEGNHKPYRAAMDESDHYFQRVGDSFKAISHSFLRSLFYPRVSPSISVNVSFKPRTPEESKVVRCWMTVCNSGTGTARDVNVLVKVPHLWALAVAGYHIEERSVSKENGVKLHMLRAKSDLHPGQSVEICRIDFDSESKHFRGGDRAEINHWDYEKVEFPIRVFCVDQSEQIIPIEFAVDEINDREIKSFFPIIPTKN